MEQAASCGENRWNPLTRAGIRLQATQLIKENETELKTLAKNVNELTFTMDAQAPAALLTCCLTTISVARPDPGTHLILPRAL